MHQILRFAVPVTVALALVTGCGDDDQVEAGGPASSAVDPDAVVSSPPATDDDSTAPVSWARIDATADLVDPVVAMPDELVADPDDPSAVLVRFYGGVPDCFGARATVLAQNADRVRIRLETGLLPELGDEACIEIAQAQELLVTLDAPLADRRLVPVPR